MPIAAFAERPQSGHTCPGNGMAAIEAKTVSGDTVEVCTAYDPSGIRCLFRHPGIYGFGPLSLLNRAYANRSGMRL